MEILINSQFAAFGQVFHLFSVPSVHLGSILHWKVERKSSSFCNIWFIQFGSVLANSPFERYSQLGRYTLRCCQYNSSQHAFYVIKSTSAIFPGYSPEEKRIDLSFCRSSYRVTINPFCSHKFKPRSRNSCLKTVIGRVGNQHGAIQPWIPPRERCLGETQWNPLNPGPIYRREADTVIEFWWDPGSNLSEKPSAWETF